MVGLHERTARSHHSTKSTAFSILCSLSTCASAEPGKVVKGASNVTLQPLIYTKALGKVLPRAASDHAESGEGDV